MATGSRSWFGKRRKRREDWVLTALRRHPTEEFTGAEICGLAHLRVGTIYPLLYDLERRGVLVARWVDVPEGRRRLYHLSENWKERNDERAERDVSRGQGDR